MDTTKAELAFNQVGHPEGRRRLRIADIAEIGLWTYPEAISFTAASPGAPALGALDPGFSRGQDEKSPVCASCV